MKKYIKPIIKKSHNIIKNSDGDLCIGEIPGTAKIISSPPLWVESALEKLDGKRTIARILKELRAKKIDVSEKDLNQLISILDNENLLEDASFHSELLSVSEMERYDRQMLQFSLFDKKKIAGFSYQEKMKESTVLVLGMGGWGTWICLQLALAGVGRIKIVDGDTVELSNLNRQVLYDKNDIGNKKVESAKKKISILNPHVVVEDYDEFLTRDSQRISEILDGVDLIVLAWASLGYYRKNTVEEILHESAKNKKIPLIELGGDPVDISVGPIYLYNKDDNSYSEQAKNQKERYYSIDSKIASFQEARMSQSFVNGERDVNAWQSCPSLATMSGLVVDQVIKILTGYIQLALVGKRFHMSMANFETRIEHIFDQNNSAE